MNTLIQYIKYFLRNGQYFPAIVFIFLIIVSALDQTYSMTIFASLCLGLLGTLSIKNFLYKKKNNHLF